MSTGGDVQTNEASKNAEAEQQKTDDNKIVKTKALVSNKNKTHNSADEENTSQTYELSKKRKRKKGKKRVVRSYDGTDTIGFQDEIEDETKKIVKTDEEDTKQRYRKYVKMKKKQKVHTDLQEPQVTESNQSKNSPDDFIRKKKKKNKKDKLSSYTSG